MKHLPFVLSEALEIQHNIWQFNGLIQQIQYLRSLGRGPFPSPLYTDHKFRPEGIEPNHLMQPKVAIISVVVQQDTEH